MHAKLMITTLALLAIAAGMLVMRHERMRLAHETMMVHRQARELSKQLWNAETLAAALVAPDRLETRIQQSRLALEPALPDALDARANRPETTLVSGPGQSRD